MGAWLAAYCCFCGFDANGAGFVFDGEFDGGCHRVAGLNLSANAYGGGVSLAYFGIRSWGKLPYRYC